MTLRRSLTLVTIAAFVLGVGLVSAIGWFGSSQALRPPWYSHRTPEQGLLPMDPAADYFILEGGYRDPTADLGLAYEEIEIPSVDGAILRGWYVPGAPNANAGVVAVHGGGSDRREFLRHVPVFNSAGYPVVLFDCREQGISDGTGRGISLGIRESEDTVAAARWMRRERGLARIAAIGTSQGGASVILAAAADPSINVVIAENPFASIYALVRDARGLDDVQTIPGWAARLVATTALWRMGGLDKPAPIEVVSRIAPRPMLLMHGTQDGIIPVAQSELLLEAAGETAELWTLDGGEHAALFNHAPNEWANRVSSFLARHLGPARSN